MDRRSFVAGALLPVAGSLPLPARAETPDGYTIGLSITGPLVNNTLLYKKLPYDPFRDLAPVTLAAVQPSVLAVSSSLVARLNRELVGALREPAVSDKLRASYMTPAPGTQKEFADFMQSELGRWKPIVERTGVSLD